jgi:hypothetical protein
MAVGSLPAVTMKEDKTGMNQSVYVDDPLVLDLLKEIKGERSGGARLFENLTSGHSRNLFRKALTRLGVEDSEFAIHSLRHGGAARDHMYKFRTFDAITRKGEMVIRQDL